MNSIICDISLAPSGHKKIAWVDRYMPTLNNIGDTLKTADLYGKDRCCQRPFGSENGLFGDGFA